MGLKYSSFAIRGIDVSTFNGVIDWTDIPAHFASIRVGYGDNMDTKFKENIEAASLTDIDLFGYWYADYYSNWFNKNHPSFGLTDEQWGRKQADNCAAWIKPYPRIKYIFLDIENMTNSTFPKLTDSNAKGHAQKINRAFLERMDELKIETGIYTSLGWIPWFYEWFRNRRLWVAWYPYRTGAPSSAYLVKQCKANGWKGEILIWQYASDGDVDDNGTSDGKTFFKTSYSFMDLNGWTGTDDQYNTMFGEVTVTPPTDPIPEPSASGAYKVSGIYGVNIRETPALSGKLLGKYNTGTIVNIAESVGGDRSQSNGWGKLLGQVGYISLNITTKI